VAVLCAGLSALPAVATISVFRRDNDDGTLRIAVAPQPGVVAQDWSARRFAMDMARPDMAVFVASRLVGPAAPKSLAYDTFLPGYLSADSDLVIGQENLYQIMTDRKLADDASRLAHLATVPRGRFRTIYACDALLAPGAGWRAWEAPATATVRVGGPLRCWRTDR
jgi:hypothetical protein